MADIERLTVKWDHDGSVIFLSHEGEHVTGQLTPIQHLLAAVATCSGLTLKAILEKMHIHHHGFVVSGKAELAGDKPNWVRTLTFDTKIFAADIEEEQLKRISELTDKYCVVAQTMHRQPEVHINLSVS